MKRLALLLAMSITTCLMILVQFRILMKCSVNKVYQLYNLSDRDYIFHIFCPKLAEINEKDKTGTRMLVKRYVSETKTYA